MGWIYIKKNLSDNAISILRELTTKYPDRAVYQYHLGMAYFQKGDKPQAKKILQGALTKKPDKSEEAKIKELIAKCG
jgi:predicted Zn-dependent protease